MSNTVSIVSQETDVVIVLDSLMQSSQNRIGLLDLSAHSFPAQLGSFFSFTSSRLEPDAQYEFAY